MKEALTRMRIKRWIATGIEDVTQEIIKDMGDLDEIALKGLLNDILEKRK